MKKLIFVMWLRLCLLAFFADGCATIATYDQLAYVQVTQVKVEVLALMDKLVNDYNLYVEEVEKVNR